MKMSIGCFLMVALCLSMGRVDAAETPKDDFDRAFYLGLFEAAQIENKAVFERLDGALDDSLPTQNAYLFVCLYRMTFTFSTGNLLPPKRHTDRGMRFIERVKALETKRPTDYVRLAVLEPIGPNPTSIEAYAEALKDEFPENAWNELLSCLQAEDAARGVMDVASVEGFTCGFGNCLMGSYYSDYLKKRPDSYLARHMRQELRGCSIGAMNNVVKRFLQCDPTGFPPGSEQRFSSLVDSLASEWSEETDLQRIEMDLKGKMQTHIHFMYPEGVELVHKYFMGLSEEGVPLPEEIRRELGTGFFDELLKRRRAMLYEERGRALLNRLYPERAKK